MRRPPGSREAAAPRPKVQALSLFDCVGDQAGRIAELEARLERLERRLGQNSRNSSLPPSGDRGQAPKRRARKRSQRKQGAQPGHPGAHRKLDEEPDETTCGAT